MFPIPSNRYDEAIFAVGIIQKVIGEKRQGVVHTPLGVRGLHLRVDKTMGLKFDVLKEDPSKNGCKDLGMNVGKWMAG